MKKRTNRGLTDMLNPIVLRELRQLVRSRFVVVTLFLLLGAMLLSGELCLIFTNQSTSGAGLGQFFETGRTLFSLFLGILMFCSVFFVPAYAGIRFARERGGINVDLCRITTITPSAIVRGKLMGSNMITILLFSVCMPFMVFTYLLRGVDLPTVFLSIFILFLVVMGLTQIALFLATIPTNRVVRGLFGIGMIWLTFVVCLMLVGLLFGSMVLGSMIMTPEFWIRFGILFLLYVLGFGLLFMLTVALVKPASANRALPVRIYATVTWALGLAIALFCEAFVSCTSDEFETWCVCSTILFSATMVIVACEDPALSRRVRNTIPKNPISRRVAFFFYNGPIGGLVWCGLLSLATIAITLVCDRFFIVSADLPFVILAIAMYAMCYVCTGFALRHRFMQRGVKVEQTWLVIALVITTACLLPALIGFFLGYSIVHEGSLWRLGNIFFINTNSELHIHITFALAWLLIVLLPSLPWIFRHARNFRADVPEPVDVTQPQEQST